MLHKMKLKESPFERIKDGTKTVEFRLFDEKRQQVKVGDQIEFSKLPDLQEKILVEVVELYRNDTFENLFKRLYNDEKEIESNLESIHQYYTQEEENEYGVIGIKIRLLNRRSRWGNYNIPHIIRQIKIYLKNGTGIDKY